MIGTIVGMISKDLAGAMASGSFFRRRRQTRNPLVDQRRRDRLARNQQAARVATGQELFEIEERVAERPRRGDTDSGTIRAKVALMQFR